MSVSGWKKRSGLAAAALLAMVGSLMPLSAVAQTGPTGTVHGHVNNAAGMPVNKGEVRFTTDRSSEEKDRKYPYKFPIDNNGDFKGDGIVPGTYLAVVYQDNKSIDFIESIAIVAGSDKAVNFDMTRKEYIDKMSPEDRKTIEEFKKKNAEVMAANSKVANLNTLLAQARTAIKARNYDEAIATMTSATSAKPDEAILWVTLGDAQLGSGDAAAAAAHNAHTSASDPAILQKYKDAAASYQKGVELNAASKKPSPDTAGAAYNQLGQSLAKAGDLKGAAAAYDNAAKAKPDQAGMYLFNEAATMLNANQNDDAAVAADKAIAADPKRADSYYIKGQALIAKVTVDAKGVVTAPPGCVEAYNRYLELAPDGPHAKDVADILTGIGAKVTSSYKAGPTKKK